MAQTGAVRRRSPAPVVVTDLREPLVEQHRRLIRHRLVLMVVWILGWAAAGFVADTAWLAIGLLVVTGPLLWVLVWLVAELQRPGRRESPVRALPGRPVRHFPGKGIPPRESH
jgi:hypothetical protein